MRVAIFGSGKLGRATLSWCKTLGLDVECFVDNYKAGGNYSVDAIPVVSMQELCKNYRRKIDSIFFSIEGRFQNFDIIINLIKSGFETYIVSSRFGIKKVNPERPPIPYVEAHVSKHCNLKCKGCQHFSNIELEQPFPSLLQFSKDIKRLSELFCEIEMVKFLGGEPLLNPDICSWFNVVKETFPNAILWLTTNGLPLLNLNEDILNSIKENKILVTISQYPPVSKVKDKIEEILVKHRIHYDFSEPIKQFRKVLSKHNKNNVKKALEICNCKHSTFLQDGKLGKCPTLMNINRHFNESFGSNFYSTDGDIIDIYNTSLSPLQILEKLYKPAHLCSYCAEDEDWQDWSAGKAEFEDWIAN